MSKKVNVLISTYNGEKYIKDQIDSILNQTYENIDVYVRDDGSSDGTIAILKDYECKGLIHFSEGNNIRWGQSFMTLLRASFDGDYWAFSDQDDIWVDKKIEWAVEWLDKQDQTIPCLFHSSFESKNENMSQSLGCHYPPNYQFTFERSITECLFQGFSIVLNKELRELMLRSSSPSLSSHDWWACMIVTEYGKYNYDNRIASYHRRLDTSMSGGGLAGKIKWFKKTLQTGNSDIRNCCNEFRLVFGSDIRIEDRKVLELFCQPTSISKNIKKAFYKKRWRDNLPSEITIRLLMLIGKI